MAILSVLAISFAIVARGGGQLVNPLTGYEDIMEGKLDAGFICRDATAFNDEMKPSRARMMCTTVTADRIFSEVRVIATLSMYQVDFTLRGDALTIGDLARLWGQPQRGLALRGHMNLQWPAQGMTTEVVSDAGQFSYFLPIERIIFTRGGHVMAQTDESMDIVVQIPHSTSDYALPQR